MRTLRDYINLVSEKSLFSERVTLPPANAVQTGSGGTLKAGDGSTVTSGTPAPDAGAAAAAKAKLTPSQLKWLGGADPTDPAIMARMPKPKPGEQVPGAQAAPAAQPAQAAPAAQPAQAAPAAQPAQAAPAAGTTSGTAAADGVGASGFDSTGNVGKPQAAAQVSQSGQAAPAGVGVDDEGNLMPGYTKDENGNVVKAGDPNFVEPATQAQATADWTAAKKKEADKALAGQGLSGAGVNAQGQATGLNVSDETGKVNPNVKKNPETGELYTPAPATGQSGQAAPASAAAGAAAPAAPAAAQTFGQAFAAARKAGQKEFEWKGKKYSTQMAGAKPAQSGQKPPAKPLPGKPVTGGPGSIMGNIDPGTGMPTNPMPESVGYNELERILSIVKYR